MKWLRNRNVLVVTVIVVLAVLLAALGLTLRGLRTISDEQLPGLETPEVSATDGSLYLLVTAGGTTFEPILLFAEDSLTLTQDEDTVNVIHVTPDSIWMESSTCENQDCVDQGVVNAENRHTRILDNMIICLPNRVQLELCDADELRAMGFTLPEAGQPENP